MAGTDAETPVASMPGVVRTDRPDHLWQRGARPGRSAICALSLHWRKAGRRLRGSVVANITNQAIRAIKDVADIAVMTDIALDHNINSHDGFVEDGISSVTTVEARQDGFSAN
jgi:delta-aminolevulinic acid dehydratase/porphobilinogen synthase